MKWIYGGFVVLALLVAGSLIGCATTPPTTSLSVHPANAADRPVNVWLIPLEGFPENVTRKLESQFAAELGLRVRSTVHAGRTPKMFGPSGQMIAERVRSELLVPVQRLYDVTPKTAFIVLTKDDLNSKDAGTRFVFARHFHDDRLSIVSSARLHESFFGNLEQAGLTDLRLYKMVKKTIGLQFYGYPRSTDLKSVMYSPVMSLQDLDDHGTAF